MQFTVRPPPFQEQQLGHIYERDFPPFPLPVQLTSHFEETKQLLNLGRFDRDNVTSSSDSGHFRCGGHGSIYGFDVIGDRHYVAIHN